MPNKTEIECYLENTKEEDSSYERRKKQQEEERQHEFAFGTMNNVETMEINFNVVNISR